MKSEEKKTAVNRPQDICFLVLLDLLPREVQDSSLDSFVCKVAKPGAKVPPGLVDLGGTDAVPD